jgi:hypothetical protein
VRLFSCRIEEWSLTMARLSRWVVACATAGAMSFLVAGCSPTGESTSATPTETRKASVIGSRLCIENATTQTIPLIRERGPFANDDHVADAAGPLRPGSWWCASGYNSYQEYVGTQDTQVEISFTSDGSDKVMWSIYNTFFDTPRIVWKKDPRELSVKLSLPVGESEEVTYPKDSEPKHDYRITRVKDSSMFKEWRLTILN